MADLTPTDGLWGAIGAAGAALIGGVLWLRKTLASTAVDVANDRAEVNIIEILQHENESLRQRLTDSERERNEQFKQIADLGSQLHILNDRVENLTRTNVQLTEDVQRLRASLEAHNA